MTCSAVVLICPVKDEAGRIFFLPALNSLQFFLPGSHVLIRRFYEARVGEVVGAVSTTNQLLKVAMSVPCRRVGGWGWGCVLPNDVPGHLFNRANCLTFTVPPS